ncbi:DNA repair helicase XPB [Aneurinibacillus tyrosinisolvens]|uniref:DNA repair helicase XPB n=1 Tax=Aneurinibacillus tyrosinisolvens TaxID=1443435 RepID=UPI00063F5F63|nr:DNA repair helicase XPB [Aneurinibacillus tyrosinisolvens]
MNNITTKPLIVQGDRTLLLEVNHPGYNEARHAISPFTELVKSPEYIHTYRMSSLSLWNAASLGWKAEKVVSILREYSQYAIPVHIEKEIISTMERFGKLELARQDGELVLRAEDGQVIEQLLSYPSIAQLVTRCIDSHSVVIPQGIRGMIKQTLMKLGYPVRDVAGYTDGEELKLSLYETPNFSLRTYQKEAVDAFYDKGSVSGGNGIIVLPCGAGKTIVGIETMVRFGMATLILTSNTTSVKQWREEIISKTTLTGDQVGIYTGEAKEVGPVTVSTYQMITHRSNADVPFPHLSLFHERNWGLIIYDEVHLLPAPVFRMTADIQAKRRLGLTATLVREDGRAEDVFSLIGPKKYELPWRMLEQQGWIATAECTEIRVPMPEKVQRLYIESGERQKFRIASENPAKTDVVRKVLTDHSDEQVLIIGQYVAQLEAIAQELKVPVITGITPHDEREKLYRMFRSKELKVLVVSRVANFAVDLPDAAVAIQISGTFGSRQEEAQRLGRILRPKKGENIARFYSLVSSDSKEEQYALKRQRFLVEQGYRYHLQIAEKPSRKI